MATQYVDVNSTQDVSGVTLTSSGTVTNSVRVHYDDTLTKEEILLALKKAEIALLRLIN